MRSSEIKFMEHRAEDFLQRAYKKICYMHESDLDELLQETRDALRYYNNCANAYRAIGINIELKYNGKGNDNINNYKHRVKFPNSAMFKNMDIDLWKD